MNYILLIIGFALLINGANYFVEGATWIANKFKIPHIIIGMTIIAIGTSLPEIIVSCVSSYNGESGMAIGNIIGANIINLCVIIGVVSIIAPVPVKRNTLLIELPMLLISEVLLLTLGSINNRLDRIDGFVFWGIFIFFIIYIIITSKKNKLVDDEVEKHNLSIWQVALYLIGGSIAIKYGGDFVVNSASNIALEFGMSYNLVGLTIVAVGTSLPEVITSIIAAMKGKTDLALGNVIGSNLFNILLALSTASIIRPIIFTLENVIDCIIFILITIIAFIFAGMRKTIVRYEGIVLLCLYTGYFIYIFLR